MPSDKLYPLRFHPIFRRYLWGGHRLATELNKPIGEESCAESWEVVDRPEANSVIASGPLADRTLHQIIESSGEQLLGPTVFDRIMDPALPAQLRGRFPLLLKFLDANKTLSVQVHPDDEAGMQKPEPDLGKTEAWFVMDSQPGSLIYAGLNEGVDRKALQLAVENKSTEQVLHQFEPKIGDCVFVPAGTVHAIGHGLLIAEIQQCSDTTYRLFDWNRIDTDGNERELHIKEALQVTDYQRGPVAAVNPQPTDDRGSCMLVQCDKFTIRRWTIEESEMTNNEMGLQISSDNQFRLLMVIDGSMRVDGDPIGQPLAKGQTMLVPASWETLKMFPDDRCEFLEITCDR